MEVTESDFDESYNLGDSLSYDPCTMLNHFKNPVDLKVQQMYLKKLSQKFSNNSENEDRTQTGQLLVLIYLFTPLKQSIRKPLSKIFDKKVCKVLNEPLCSCLLNEIRNICSSKNLFSNTDFLDNVINSLYVTIGNEFICIDSIIYDIFVFLNETLCKLLEMTQSFTTSLALSLEQIHYYLQHFIRIILPLCQKYRPSDNLSSKLLFSCFNICVYKNVNFETRANCAHIMLILSKYELNVFGPNNNEGRSENWKQFITLLNNKGNNQKSKLKTFLNFDQFLLDDDDMKESFAVCIMLAILKTVPLETLQLYKVSNDYSIVVYFLNELLENIRKATGKPAQILETTQALIFVSNSLNCLNSVELKVVFEEVLSFIFSHLDHYMNTIRSNTVDIFVKLIKVAKEQETNDLIKLIVNEIFKRQEGSGNNFYQALEVLTREIGGCSVVLAEHPEIPNSLLCNLQTKKDLANEIFGCFKNLMTLNYKEQSRRDWIEAWIKPILVFLNNNNNKNNTQRKTSKKFYQILLVEAFKIDQIVLKTLLLSEQDGTEDVIIVYLGFIHHLRKHDISLKEKEIYEKTHQETSLWRNLIDYDILEELKFNHNDIIRVYVLALIVDSHKSTEIFTAWELEFLVSYFEENTSVLSANTRQEITALAKKMFNRYNESIKVLKKNKLQIVRKIEEAKKPGLDGKLSEISESLKHYRNFWFALYSKALSVGLHLGANFSRRASCLNLLILSSRIIEDDEWFSAWGHEDIEKLKKIIECDTYESNKDLAVQLSKKIGYRKLGLEKNEDVRSYFEITLTRLLSVKPSDTLSAVYMLPVVMESPCITEIMKEQSAKQLLCSDEKLFVTFSLFLEKIFEAIECAKENLRNAAQNKPLHGLYLALRHLIQYVNFGEEKSLYREIIEKIIDSCFMVLPIIFQVVCNSSPEGYIPEEEEEIGTGDETASAQTLLVYTWRTAKETSLLLGEIGLNLSILDEKNPDGLIRVEMMRKIGDFFIDFLMTVKHRGAFEQGYIGFTNYCRRLWSLHNHDLNKLPEIWLKKIIESLEKNLQYINACATRRSAGLPFMVQAILTTEPNTEGNKLFHYTMNALIALTTAGSEDDNDNNDTMIEQVVHAMNILKALYKHYRLGELATPYVAQGVKIAVTGLSSKNWSIRNSATLLFSSLMTRMFGVQRNKIEISSKNKLTSHVFFMRYPLLYDFLLDQLVKGSRDDVNCPSLYGVLLILGRLYRGKRGDDTKYTLKVFLPYVETCLSNVVAQTRELAAEASVALILRQDRHEYIHQVFQKLRDTKKENYKHGLLLQLKYFFKEEDLRMSEIPVISIMDSSHFSGALYFSLLFSIIKNSKNEIYLREFFSHFSSIITKEQRGFKTKKREISTATITFKIYMTAFQLISAVYTVESRQFVVKSLNEQLFSMLISNDCKSLRIFALNVINYLEMDLDNDNLYLTEELELEEIAMKFVQLLPHEIKQELNKTLKNTTRIFLLYFFEHLPELIKEDKLVVCCFISLRRHVDLLDKIFKSPSEVLEFLISFCEIRNDELITSSVLDVITLYVINLGYGKSEAGMEFSRLISFLENCISHNYKTSISVKLSACDFFLKNAEILNCKEQQSLLTGSNLIRCWFLIIILSEDDDVLVRTRISHFVIEKFNSSSTISSLILPKYNLQTIEVSKQKILVRAINVLPKSDVIPFLLALIFRNTEFDKLEGYETATGVFERGSINVHSEVQLTTCKALKYLKTVLEEEKTCEKKKMVKLLEGFHIASVPEEVKTIAVEALKKMIEISPQNPEELFRNNQLIKNDHLKIFFRHIINSN